MLKKQVSVGGCINRLATVASMLYLFLINTPQPFDIRLLVGGNSRLFEGTGKPLRFKCRLNGTPTIQLSPFSLGTSHSQRFFSCAQQLVYSIGGNFLRNTFSEKQKLKDINFRKN